MRFSPPVMEVREGAARLVAFATLPPPPRDRRPAVRGRMAGRLSVGSPRQTAVPALNAKRAAASAGGAAMGLAGIAGQARRLARRPAPLAIGIEGLADPGTDQFCQCIEITWKTGPARRRIGAGNAVIGGLAPEISTPAAKQTTDPDAVNAAVNQIDQVTPQNDAVVEGSTAAIQSSARDSEKLVRPVSKFRDGEFAPVATAQSPAALARAGSRRKGRG